ncbi:hypothetical protein MTR67_036072 [Solanum verrucosum]|uniref:Protein kinase domain-containing protein n=1 Tax=Solanum verrucosum TaxID=315347 RepID=A0AAF0UB18_SOLVR|nr:hypothetical protein MTR67_036072 [Solanum verrucosum]
MEERQLLFEKYEIGTLLGKGTFAKVYYGKELETGESVAIKVIKKDQVQKEGMMEQITRYVKGGELFAKLVSKGKFKEDTARKYFQQLISAVDYCHSRGVYHRDLVKPFKLKMQCPEEGRKGRLLVTAEVFKVAPEVTVVELSKSSGDTLEYNKFCEEEVRPALKDIVWTWQGTGTGNADIDNKKDLEQ